MSKTLINGTSYDVARGVLKMEGTAYNIQQGKTKVDGTGYDIKLGNRRRVFNWGNNYELVDGDWLLRLQQAVQNSTPKELEDAFAIGMRKKINIPLNSLDYDFADTQMNIRIIGVNHDGDNTITFDCPDVLATTLYDDPNILYGSSPNLTFDGLAQWKNSTLRQVCQDIYEIFPNKEVIKEVTKGTNLLDTRASLGYTKDKIWLPSRWELGYTSGYYTAGQIYHPIDDMADMDNLAPEYTVGGKQEPYPLYARDSIFSREKHISNVSEVYDSQGLTIYTDVGWPYWSRSRMRRIPSHGEILAFAEYGGNYVMRTWHNPPEWIRNFPYGGPLRAISSTINGQVYGPEKSYLSPCFTIG